MFISVEEFPFKKSDHKMKTIALFISAAFAVELEGEKQPEAWPINIKDPAQEFDFPDFKEAMEEAFEQFKEHLSGLISMPKVLQSVKDQKYGAYRCGFGSSAGVYNGPEELSCNIICASNTATCLEEANKLINTDPDYCGCINSDAPVTVLVDEDVPQGCFDITVAPFFNDIKPDKSESFCERRWLENIDGESWFKPCVCERLN
eukprot:GHVP01037457.1.p3 GENE.GHVP01037457.1~~GHVP01037457.1.p3  ORF type:complete len:204 (+),score=36.75 GHVP01037457.1:98-709(+)